MRASATIVGFAILAASLLAAPIVACAGTEREVELLRAFFGGRIASPTAIYSQSLLEAVPAEKLEEVRRMYLDKLGEFRDATGAAGSYDLLFERGKAPGKVHFDAAGLVDGFWLGSWTLLDDAPERLLAEFRRLPGSVSVALTRDADDLCFALDPDRPLAIGSAFKLYVLAALVNRIASGQASLDTVVPLDDAYRSLPSGVLQEWPAGSPLTLATLANLMISLSDNTATDQLMAWLGRSAIEALCPPTMRHCLTTMEMFRIKYGPPDRAERFAAADEATRRTMLAAIASEPVTIASVRSTPYLVDTVEWFVSTRELCRQIFALREQPALAINPGLVQKSAWHRVGFKGGSEPGVLNYTLLLQKASASATFCLSATINNRDRPVATRDFNELVLRLIGLIERGGFDR